MELCLLRPALHRVRRGQTLAVISRTFGVPPRLLAAVNGLCAEPPAGTLLLIPPACNVYRVRGGETRALLCGSDEAFAQKNGTRCLYPGQIVAL